MAGKAAARTRPGPRANRRPARKPSSCRDRRLSSCAYESHRDRVVFCLRRDTGEKKARLAINILKNAIVCMCGDGRVCVWTTDGRPGARPVVHAISSPLVVGRVCVYALYKQAGRYTRVYARTYYNNGNWGEYKNTMTAYRRADARSKFSSRNAPRRANI